MATIFVAGIIQGSIRGSAIHQQDYRERIVGLLRAEFPDVAVYCPIENYPNSLEFPDEVARRTFFGLMDRAGRADVLVAYVPEASMGTAVEMWQAHGQGRLVIAISPLATNWAVRFLSHTVLPDIEAFEQFVRSGDFAQLLDAKGIIAPPARASQPHP